MEPISIALICAAALGTVMLLAAFIRQIMLSRDKQLNDEAQNRALLQEVSQLEKMRVQMQNMKRFDSHYQILGVNKDAIKYLDSKIEEILHKKNELVERYAKVSIKESGSIMNGEISLERKSTCDQLREKIDREIAFYNEELKQHQERRKNLWDAHTDFQRHLLEQEKSRNDNLDYVYQQHSALLEKVYLRHIDNTENVAVKGVEASTISFKDLIMIPIQFLMQYFGVSPGISLIQTRVEKAARVKVEQVQRDINDPKLQQNIEKEPHKEKHKQHLPTPRKDKDNTLSDANEHDKNEEKTKTMNFA